MGPNGELEVRFFFSEIIRSTCTKHLTWDGGVEPKELQDDVFYMPPSPLFMSSFWDEQMNVIPLQTDTNWVPMVPSTDMDRGAGAKMCVS